MKTFNDFREETSQVSELSIGARKAQARRLKVIGSKASTKFKKAKNKLKAMTQDVALKKGMKKARNVIMQKVAGKGKDLSDLAIAQKERLEKATDKRIKAMGGKYKALAKKFAKKIKKDHSDAKAKAQADKAEKEA